MGLTIMQAMKLDGLKNGSVLSGQENLDREIEFVDIIEAPIGEDWGIRGGLFITTFFAIKDNLAEQFRTIDVLVEQGCAALVFQLGQLNSFPESLAEYARQKRFPIIVIPRDVTYPTLIQPLVGSILREKAVLLQRSDEINRQLMDICLEEGGIEKILTALGKLLKCPVSLLDPWGEPVASDSSDAETLADISPAALRRLDERVHASPVFVSEYNAWFKKLFVGKRHGKEGFLMISDPEHALTALDLVAVEHASTAIMLEIVKRRAIIEMEQRMRCDFIEKLLSSKGKELGGLVEQAHRLGWDLKDKHLIALFQVEELQLSAGDYRASGKRTWQNSKTLFFEQAARLFLRENPTAILAEQSGVLIFIPECRDKTAEVAFKKRLSDLVAMIIALVRKISPATEVSVGIGSYYAEIDGLLQSFNEARSVLDVSKRLGMPPGVRWYDDMILYCLLEKLAAQNETVVWLRQTMGPLLDYDKKKGTELVRTLEAFLDCGQNAQKAAFLLNVHPKTLQYRMGSIKSLLALETLAGEQQLILHVGCKMLKLVRFT